MATKRNPAELVPQVRAELTEEINADMNDHDVTRFLMARDLNLAKTVTMIKKWHEWFNKPFSDFDIAPERRELRPRDIQTYSPDDKEELWGQVYPMSNLGVDKQGRPIYWEKSGIGIYNLCVTSIFGYSILEFAVL